MCKKTFILVSVFFVAIFLFSNLAYANNQTNAQDVKNGINNVGSTIVDGVQNLGNTVRNGIGNAENGIEGALNMDDNNNNGNNNENNNNNNDNNNDRTAMDTRDVDYTATRTGDDATLTGGGTDNTTTWVWLIVGIAAIVVIGIIWYYATQNTNRHHDE